MDELMAATESGSPEDPPVAESQTEPPAADALAAEVAQLRESNQVLQEEKAALSERLRAFEGLDADRVRAVMERLEQDEDVRLIAEGRVEEVVMRRGERLAREQAALLAQRDERIAELEAQLAARDEQLARRVVDDQIREAAAASGMVASAMEDALNRGRQVFSLDDAGQAVALASDGTVRLAAESASPLSPKDWLESLRSVAPHWWPPSSGGAAPGALSVVGEGPLSYEQAGQLEPERYRRLRREGASPSFSLPLKRHRGPKTPPSDKRISCHG